MVAVVLAFWSINSLLKHRKKLPMIMTSNRASSPGTSIRSAAEDVLRRLDAMRSDEDAAHCTYNYITKSKVADATIDEACRRAMVEWCFQVQRALDLSPETVSIAVSCMDRYLSSGKGRSPEALRDRYKFQLSAITGFYIAVGRNEESIDLNVDALVRLCGGGFQREHVLAMEEDMLLALERRVCCPTPMEFVTQLMHLLPWNDKLGEQPRRDIVEACQRHVEETSSDIYFAFSKPSVVGASCLASALTRGKHLTSGERSQFWLHLAKVTDLIDVMEAQNRLLAGRRVRKSTPTDAASARSSASISSARTATSKKSMEQMRRGSGSSSSSAVSIMQAAVQA